MVLTVRICVDDCPLLRVWHVPLLSWMTLCGERVRACAVGTHVHLVQVDWQLGMFVCLCCVRLACSDCVPAEDLYAGSSCVMGARACALACEHVHLSELCE